MKVLIGLLLLAALALVGFAGSSAQGHGDRTPGTSHAKLAITRVAPGDVVAGGAANPLAEIWAVDDDGSHAERITDNDTFDLGAVWSPNGKTIAFYSEGADGVPRIFLVDADDDQHEQRLLTSTRSRWPSWSRGGRIAFDNGGPSSGDILVVNSDGTDEHRLTHGDEQEPKERNIRPAWSPNGEKIAFTSRRDGNDEIYVMNADGSDPVNLTRSAGADNAAAWSPNGQQIVFQSNRDGNTEIYSMNADGTCQTRLTDYPGRDQDADWSPDGRTIAFERDAEPITDLTLQVFLMDADGSHERQLTTLDPDGENSHPGWEHGRHH